MTKRRPRSILPLILFLILISGASWTIWRVSRPTPKTSSSLQNSQKLNSEVQNQTNDAQQTTSPQPEEQSPTGTGIRGETFRGAATGCFSPEPSSPCNSSPHTQATVELFSKVSAFANDSKLVATINSDASGQFSIDIRPGDYILVPKPLATGETAASQTVNVIENIYTKISITYN